MCGLDTAFNYRGFTSHAELARVAGDLLGEFTLSTKVGYFPNALAPRAEHSLDPARLAAAIQQSANDLGRAPDVVLLHNPEVSLADLSPGEGADRMELACATLDEQARAGLCYGWGIASWDPRPVVTALEATPSQYRPDVLLLRSGLSVGEPVVRAAERLQRVLRVGRDRCWGMSPFGGDAADPAWRTADLAPFLEAGTLALTEQVAYRLAYEVPAVRRVAVGTSTAAHLRELVAAVGLPLADGAVARYREMLRRVGV